MAEQIDEIFMRTNENYRKFNSSLKSEKYKFNIKYWYDINERRFINEIVDYNNTLYQTQICSCNLYTNNFQYLKNISLLDNDIESYYIHELQYKTNKDSKIESVINNISMNEISFIFDDYLNIYIPRIQTILIYNYIKFPIYSLFLLKNNININKIYSFNEYNTNDMQQYRLIENYIKDIDCYLKSQNARDYYNDGSKFIGLLEFINYKKYIDIINNDIIKPYTCLFEYIQKKEIQQLPQIITETIEYNTIEDKTIMYVSKGHTKALENTINIVKYTNSEDEKKICDLIKYNNTLEETIKSNEIIIDKFKNNINTRNIGINKLNSLKEYILKEETIKEETIKEETLKDKIDELHK